MLKKLFSSENKYFLELKESDAVQTAVETTKKVASAAKETASEVVDVAQEKLESAVSTEEKPAESKVKTEAKPKQVEVKPAKSEAKDKAKAKEKPAPPQAKVEQNGSAKDSEAQTVGNTGASSYDPPFWVAAMYNNDSKETNGNGRAEQTFAPENLMPIATKFRRRPGGSLDKFKDMAKQAKTPKG